MTEQQDVTTKVVAFFFLAGLKNRVTFIFLKKEKRTIFGEEARHKASFWRWVSTQEVDRGKELNAKN